MTRRSSDLTSHVCFLAVIAFMMTTYVVLDGFDFGAGTVSLLIARSDAERRAVIAAIGPFFDGNEVWLITSGGVFLASFPIAVAAAFSGLYMPIFFVLWCLILRGITIEMLLHMKDGVGRTLSSFVFGMASAGLSLLLGIALGNVVRGMPLTGDGELGMPLFTSFLPRAPVGVLDAYTLLLGLLAVVALALHGALFLSWKTVDPLRDRVRVAVKPLFIATTALYLLAVAYTSSFVPLGPRAGPGLALAALSFAFAFVMWRRGNDLRAFLGSCAFIASSLLGLAYARGAIVLADVGHHADLTAEKAVAPEAGLRAMLVITIFGLILVVATFAVLFRIHKGKLTPPHDERTEQDARTEQDEHAKHDRA